MNLTIHDVTFPDRNTLRLSGPGVTYTFPFTGTPPEDVLAAIADLRALLLSGQDASKEGIARVLALIGTPAVIVPPPPPPPPAQVAVARPAWVNSSQRLVFPLTEVTSTHKLLTVGVGKQFATIGEAFRWVADDASGLIPIIRVDPGDYVGEANFPFHGYCSKPFILEAADPLKMFRLVQGDNGLHNGKSPFAINGPGIFEFRNMEACDFLNPNTGMRGNWCVIAPEWGTVGRIDVRAYGCLLYSNNNGLGRGSPETYWDIDGTVCQHCGLNGEGYSHNFYLLGASAVLNRVTSLEAQVGHLFKSRTLITKIKDSRFLDLDVGTSSYRLDFPDGGHVELEGLLLHSGKNATNRAAIHYGGENPGDFHDGSSLALADVTVFNERFDGSLLVNQSPNKLRPSATGTKVFGVDPSHYYDDGVAGKFPDEGLIVLSRPPLLV